MSAAKNTRFTKEWKIGLVSAVIVALFVWVSFFLAGRNILSKETTLYAVVDNAGGVNISGPVVINGKKVGRVSEIEFVSETDHRIRVGMSISKKYKIPEGSQASLESLGLMVGSGVVIRLGNGPGFLKEGDYMEGVEVPDLIAQLEPMEARISSILTSLDSILQRFNRIVDDNSVKDFQSSIVSFHASMRHVESLTAGADGLVRENSARLNRVIANLQELSQTLVDNKAGISNVIANFSAISDTLAKAQVASMLASLKESLYQAEMLFTGINRGDGSIGQLLTNDSLYRNLEKSSRQLDLLLQDLRVNPERYVHISVFGKKEKKSQKPPLE